MPSLLTVGYGYTARAVAARLQERGWSVSGTSRDGSGPSNGSNGVELIRFTGAAPSEELGRALGSATHLLVTAPPAEAGDSLLRHHSDDIVASDSLVWIGYLSTTGVYGDQGGAWVDEGSEPEPGTERSRRRLEAEGAWTDIADRAGTALQIYRLAGIYGPGRSTFDRLRDGTAKRIVGSGAVFNRIHVDDIAGAVVAGIDRPEVRGVVNLSDERPAPPDEVVVYAARLLGTEPPSPVALEDAELSPVGRSFYAENKRVRSRRLGAELGYTLRFPSYEEGLSAILRDDRGETP